MYRLVSVLVCELVTATKTCCVVPPQTLKYSTRSHPTFEQLYAFLESYRDLMAAAHTPTVTQKTVGHELVSFLKLGNSRGDNHVHAFSMTTHANAGRTRNIVLQMARSIKRWVRARWLSRASGSARSCTGQPGCSGRPDGSCWARQLMARHESGREIPEILL